MTEPLRADARRNRARLIDAASDCIGRAGADASMASIAAAAGVGEATLFRHFATRADLVEAVMLRCLDESEQAVADALALDAPEGLEYLLSHFAHSLLRDRNLWSVADELMTRPEIAARQQAVVKATRKLLTGAKRAGRVYPDVRLDDLLTVLEGIAMAADREHWRAPLALVLRGVFVPPG